MDHIFVTEIIERELENFNMRKEEIEMIIQIA